MRRAFLCGNHEAEENQCFIPTSIESEDQTVLVSCVPDSFFRLFFMFKSRGKLLKDVYEVRSFI